MYTQTHDTPANTRRSSRYATCTPRHTTPQQTPDIHQGTPHVHPDTRHPSKHRTFIMVHHVYTQTHDTPANTRRSSAYGMCTARHTTPQQILDAHQVRHVYSQTHGTPTNTRRSSGYATCTPRHTTPQQTPDVHQGTPRVHPDTRHHSKHQTLIRVRYVYTRTHAMMLGQRRRPPHILCNILIGTFFDMT